MLPTLKPNQEVLALCWFYKIKIGDLVVFKKSGKNMIKRVKRIMDKKIYVLGDNRNKSTDSREFGWIRLNQVSGKVIGY